MAKSAPRIIISRIIVFIIFLILLAIANVLVPAFNSNVYSSIVNFLNSNIILLFILTIIGMINEIFWSFYFPFNIIAPITGSILGVYIVAFVYRCINFLDIFINNNSNIMAAILPEETASIIVFWIVFIAGYLIILIRQGKPKEDWHEEMKKWHEQRWERKREKLKKKIEKLDTKLGKKQMKWGDVGNEFKHLFYNIGKSINNLFDKDKKKR